MPALRTSAARITLPADGTGRIVVVADTHSRPHPAIGARLADLRPTAILHAGDVGDLAVLDALAAYAPVFAVRGNIDVHAPGLPDQLVIDVEGHPTGTLRILLVHIAVYGPRLRAEIGRAARAAGAHLVVCGHSHVPFIGVDRGLTMFNPGSIGPRRFTLPIVFGTIEFGPPELGGGRTAPPEPPGRSGPAGSPSTGVRLTHIECETGAVWLPPG